MLDLIGTWAALSAYDTELLLANDVPPYGIWREDFAQAGLAEAHRKLERALVAAATAGRGKSKQERKCIEARWTHDPGLLDLEGETRTHLVEAKLFEAIVSALRELRVEEASLLDCLAPTTIPRVLSVKTARRLGALFRFVESKELRPKVLATFPEADEKDVTRTLVALKRVTAAFSLHKQGALIVLEDEPTRSEPSGDDQIDSK